MSHRTRSFAVVLLTYFIDMFGLATPYPIFTPLLLKTEFGFVSQELLFYHRTILLGLLIAFFPLAQFFGGPFIGEFSDRKGRKTAFKLTILGTGIGYAMTAVGILSVNLPLLFLSRLWTGFFAGNLTICLASISDMSTDSQSRAKNFGLIGAVGGLGFIAPILFGQTLSFAPSLSFWLLSLLSLINLGLVILYFEESHHLEKPQKWKWSIGLQHIRQAFKERALNRIYLVFFLFMIAWVNAMQFLPTFLFGHYSIAMPIFTTTFVAIGVVWSFSNLFINRILAQHLPVSVTLKSCLILLTVFLFSLTIPSPPTVFLILFICATLFASLSWTNCLTKVSLSAPNEIQGRILGINQSMGALAAVIGPILGGFIAGLGPPYTYLLSAIATLLACIVLYLIRPSR